ncbi:hypothetical protein [Nocardia sp. NPDC127526]|uniref:DUF7373 family lipoprotein n=1 Tax=Nocardia sp. NPDC127526 TaxID=3345393 RepID=UPI0036422EC8
MGKTRKGLSAALMVIALGAASACGTDSPEAEPEPVIDLAALDVGSYRAEPKDFQPKEPLFVGRAFEAERIGSSMPLPSEMDSRLKVNLGHVVHGFLEPGTTHDSPMYTYLQKDGFTEDAKGFVAGFATTGQSEEEEAISFSMSTSALLFETEQQATEAAGALARRGWEITDFIGSEFVDVTNVPGKVQPTQSAEHPSAISSWVPDEQRLASWFASGKFVIVAVADHTENQKLGISDQNFLQTLTDAAITATAERLKSFQPTPVDKLGSIDFDPEGMMRISLRRLEGDSFMNLPGVYDVPGYLHLTENPEKVRELFDEHGVDRVSSDAGTLYRTRDSAAAKDFLATESVDKYMRKVESPPGLPIARCNKYRGPERAVVPYYCYVSYDRYVSMVWGSQLSDAHQRISAQYAILARGV